MTTVVRKALRIKAYDYAQPGFYFLTITTQQRICNLAEFGNQELRLTQLGKVVESCWNEIPSHFPLVRLDMHVIMPNHLHGIIEICPAGNEPCAKGTFRTVIAAFKGACTRIWRKQRGSAESIWQRDYYERIVRNESELLKFRTYIIQNPEKWELDKLNPTWRF